MVFQLVEITKFLINPDGVFYRVGVFATLRGEESFFYAHIKPIGQAWKNGGDIQNHVAGFGSLASKAGSLHSCLHDNAEEAELGLEKSGPGPVDQRDGGDFLYSG